MISLFANDSGVYSIVTKISPFKIDGDQIKRSNDAKVYNTNDNVRIMTLVYLEKKYLKLSSALNVKLFCKYLIHQ